MTKILFHDIEYWYEGFPSMELLDQDREFIIYMINNGYSSGEMSSSSDEENYHGWWQIKGFETQDGSINKNLEESTSSTDEPLTEEVTSLCSCKDEDDHFVWHHGVCQACFVL